MKGSGMKAIEMNPRREFPQPNPSALYMEGPTKGNRAAKRQRKTVLAAVTEAAWTVYASTRYMALAIYGG
jgi:hypothetical protein